MQKPAPNPTQMTIPGALPEQSDREGAPASDEAQAPPHAPRQVMDTWEDAYEQARKTPPCPDGCLNAYPKWHCLAHGRGYPGWSKPERQEARVLGTLRRADDLFDPMYAFVRQRIGTPYPISLMAFRKQLANLESNAGAVA